jgi:hypothetical protein
MGDETIQQENHPYMSHFMLMLYDSQDAKQAFATMSPDDMQKALEKYMAWRKAPFCVDGKRLADDHGKVVRSTTAGKATATDGPYSESKEILGGYYTIEAANYDEALKLTLGHPHLEHGGTIELRQVYGN